MQNEIIFAVQSGLVDYGTSELLREKRRKPRHGHLLRIERIPVAPVRDSAVGVGPQLRSTIVNHEAVARQPLCLSVGPQLKTIFQHRPQPGTQLLPCEATLDALCLCNNVPSIGVDPTWPPRIWKDHTSYAVMMKVDNGMPTKRIRPPG